VHIIFDGVLYSKFYGNFKLFCLWFSYDARNSKCCVKSPLLNPWLNVTGIGLEKLVESPQIFPTKLWRPCVVCCCCN